MLNILITGVSRGIGLSLLQQSLENGHRVFGVARSPQESKELQELQKKYSDTLFLFKADVTDPDVSNKIIAVYPWDKIDLLINNAGIYQEDTWEGFAQSFNTNSIAPYFLTKGLFSLLKKSDAPKAAFISSMMGSIEDNESGGSVSYRASKTALNMMVKCLSIDEKWLVSQLYHPGWVKTRMGGVNAPTETSESSAGLLSLMHSSTIKDSGTFKNFKGLTIGW